MASSPSAHPSQSGKVKKNEVHELPGAASKESLPGTEFMENLYAAQQAPKLEASDPCEGVRIGDTVYYWINANTSSPPVPAIVVEVLGNGILDLSLIMPRSNALDPRLGVAHQSDSRLNVSKFHREKGCWSER